MSSRRSLTDTSGSSTTTQQNEQHKQHEQNKQNEQHKQNEKHKQNEQNEQNEQHEQNEQNEQQGPKTSMWVIAADASQPHHDNKKAKKMKMSKKKRTESICKKL